MIDGFCCHVSAGKKSKDKTESGKRFADDETDAAEEAIAADATRRTDPLPGSFQDIDPDIEELWGTDMYV